MNFPNQPERIETLPTFYRGHVEYLNSSDIARIFSVRKYVNNDVNKLVLKFREGDVKITAFSSFVVANDRAYQMPTPCYFDGKEFYIPARPFFAILSKTVLAGSEFVPARHLFVAPGSLNRYNILSANVEEKQNGTLIRLRTSQRFDERNIVRYIDEKGWLIIQIPEGVIDTLGIMQSRVKGIIRETASTQREHSAEVRFRLAEKVDKPEVFQSGDGSELMVVLRNPGRRGEDRTHEMRAQWYLDTIVIDAGHGGKDGGAVGRGGLKEKTVTLDVALRLGKLLKRNTNTQVVYTRDEDIFIPVFQRTKIANEAGGKLFISIHVNSSPKRQASGFETYLLSPANTEESIETARLENGVIALEESEHRYEEFSNETLILATMAQSAWMKESEELASMIQLELAKRLNSPSRGVKQAGFYVLIGASMPNVLAEIGFVSNPHEEQKLARSDYRQRIANGLYDAILVFKEKYEGLMLAEQ